jgi:hypothetical protein
MQWLKQRAILISAWAMRVSDLHRLTAATEHAAVAATSIHSPLSANNRMSLTPASGRDGRS